MVTIPLGFVSSTWQVLTRRAQLAMKEDKQKKRKLAEEEKKAVKEAEPKSKRRRSAKQEKEEQPEPEVEEKEPEVAKPRRRLRQMKTSACIPEDPPAEEPKPKAASRKPAKAKGEAKPKTEPKKKKNAKKTVAKTPEKVDTEAAESDDQHSVATPQKELFQSDDDGEDEGPHDRFDEKPGKVATLQKALDKCLPEGHMTAKRQRKGSAPATASGASMEDVEKIEKKPKRRAKKKVTKPTSPGDLSPFAKKEVKRRESQRKKAEDSVMKNAAREDLQIQGVILQHMKNVEKITGEDAVKKYLVDSLKDKTLNKEYRLNEYWKRPAIGVKAIGLGDGSLKNAPEVAYFGKSCVGACPSDAKLELTVMYVAASLMVFRLHIFFGSF